MKNTNLHIVEGYEMTGKSTYIRSMTKKSESNTYRPSYEMLNIDRFLPRESRFILGLSILDFITQNKGSVSDKVMILDRSLPSSLVYSKIYNGVAYDEMVDVIDAYMKLYKELNAVFTYKYHESKEHAHKIYNTALVSRAKSLDKYDIHESFDRYWEMYTEFDKEFRNVFSKLKLKVIMSPSDRNLPEKVVQY